MTMRGMSGHPPVLEYATPRRGRVPKPPTPVRTWLIVWSVLLGIVFCASIGPAQGPQDKSILGFVWASILIIAMVCVTIVLPMLINNIARRNSLAELPVRCGHRIALRILLALTLLLGTCIQTCPHGAFLHISSASFTLQGGPPCKNPPHLELFILWLLRKAVGG